MQRHSPTNLKTRTIRLFAYATSVAALLAFQTNSAAAAACPKSPTPVTTFNLERYYTDKAGTIVNPAIKKRNARTLKPLKQFVRTIVSQADKAVRKQSAKHASCALLTLRAWAKAGTYIGPLKSKQSEYQRKWDLAGISLAYLKLQPFASPSDRAAIEPWLKSWAATATAFFDNRGRKRNNHWYWLGLGVAAVALATDDDAMWRQARAIFQDAMRDIRPDGTLPFERARGSRSLHYHTFALMPLIVMAELATAKGEDWYQGADAPLHRLTKLVATAHTNTKTQAILTDNGKKQSHTKPGAGWLPLYKLRFPNRISNIPLEVRAKHLWLGGDVMILSRALKNRAMGNSTINPTHQP